MAQQDGTLRLFVGTPSLADGEAQDPFPFPISTSPATGRPSRGGSILLVLLPLLIVLSTLLFLLLVFLIAVIWTRRRRGIRLVEDGGPLDLSINDGVPQASDGGIDGVAARWMEQVDEATREGYRRSKDFQQQYPPSSVATDITLSQFLSIQEKGVSAWCFEPDYESNLSLYVESRTEITFLSDGPGMAMREGGGNTVLANLPLPKLNEVYYWEAKMYEKPASTEVVVGLATKPFPSFRLPGWAKVSVGYFSSDGFKCHNYPFTASSHGPPLAEGDVLGVGYRPRTGTVFFTRNGRKLDDCYRGLQNFNLFPAIGANGPATVHVNLGQAGFVFIEANVKKWGLAPMMGTLAPPPAYGSERGSILLDAGYGTPNARNNLERSMDPAMLVAAARQMAAGGDLRVDHRLLSSSQGSNGSNQASGPSSFPAQLGQAGFGVAARHSQTGNNHRRTQSHRDRRPPSMSSAAPPSPLRIGSPSNSNTAGPSRKPRRDRRASRLSQDPARYHSPTDQPDLQRRFPQIEGGEEAYSDGSDSASEGSQGGQGHYSVGSSPDSSPRLHNPPTPNGIDISLRSLHQHARSASYFGGRADRRDDEETAGGSGSSDATIRQGPISNHGALASRNPQGWPSSNAQHRAVAGVAAGDLPPPGYSPLDPHVYQDGVPTDLPAEVISQAFEAADRADQQRREQEAAANREQNAGSGGFWNRIIGSR